MPPLITLHVDGRMGVLTLNRPGQLNALTPSMLGHLKAHLDALESNPAVTCAVVTGAGRAFSAGVDLASAAEMFSSDPTSRPSSPVTLFRAFSKPVVAAVNGPAFTGGWELALAADLVVASRERAVFADTHATFGIAPSWRLSVLLARAAGVHRAADLHLTSRRVSADEALGMGLVSRVVPHERLMDECRGIADALAAQYAPALPYFKRLLRDGADLAFGDAVAQEAGRAEAYYKGMTAEQFAAMAAFLAKRRRKASAPSKL